MLFELGQALADAEILLGSVLAHHKEAPGLGKLGMLSDLEVIKILQFGLALVVKLQKLTDKVRIVAGQLFPVFLQVEDGAGLALDLVNVGIVSPSDLIRGTGTLGCATLTTFLGLSC